MRSVIRNLYLAQVRGNGISASDYAKLYPGEKRMLEKKGCKDVKFLDGSLAAWPYKVKKTS